MKQRTTPKTFPVLLPAAAFFLVEVFAFFFLREQGHTGIPWPLAFGALWSLLLTGILTALPRKAGRIAFGITYFLAVLYAGIQTGYYHLFRNMMWISEFRYASEGSDYFSVLLEYPVLWWLSIAALVAAGVLILCRFPRRKAGWQEIAASVLVSVIAAVGAGLLPEAVFLQDRSIQYASSDYGRAQSAEAAYVNMFNPYRLYRVCGLYQTGVKDIYANYIYPLTPGYGQAQQAARQTIDSYFAKRGDGSTNEMTGLFAGKNVILVLMESMDDWSLGTHTPTINRMLSEGIRFSQFYTPGFGGVRTFNSEFCVNTGSFLTTSGGYAFDYITNDYRQSLANCLKAEGYSPKVYHYNDPSFYSRGVFSPAMGYEEYVCYADYLDASQEKDLYDDQLLFDNAALSDSFFREGKTLNFIITRSAHLSYVYNEVLSYWGLQKYPQYRGMTGHEEIDCMYLKARLVDDMFARLLQELEARGELERTVIVAVTDHYTYGIQDKEMLLEQSGVTDPLLLEKTPCFIWSADGPALDVTKTLNTSDLLPTLLNLMGIPQSYPYLGQDAFREDYPGYVLFPDGSWIQGNTVYNAGADALYCMQGDQTPGAAEEALAQKMSALSQEYIAINNLILETDYYHLSPTEKN